MCHTVFDTSCLFPSAVQQRRVTVFVRGQFSQRVRQHAAAQNYFRSYGGMKNHLIRANYLTAPESHATHGHLWTLRDKTSRSLSLPYGGRLRVKRPCAE